MHGRFLRTTYKRDLKKLQRLNQGNKSIHDYYQEMQITMLHYDVQECDEDRMVRFHSGLRREILDIVDYKDYNTTNRLLHLALLAEKELQGRQQAARNTFGTSSTPRSTLGQAKTAPFLARTRTPTPSSSPRVPEVIKSSSSATSTGHAKPIVCHRCHGMGHVMKDCPSQRAYIATDDGGYVVLVMLRMKLHLSLILQLLIMMTPRLKWEMKFWVPLPLQIIEPLLCSMF